MLTFSLLDVALCRSFLISPLLLLLHQYYYCYCIITATYCIILFCIILFCVILFHTASYCFVSYCCKGHEVAQFNAAWLLARGGSAATSVHSSQTKQAKQHQDIAALFVAQGSVGVGEGGGGGGGGGGGKRNIALAKLSIAIELLHQSMSMTHPINTHPIITPYQYTPYQYTLSIHILSIHTLSIHPINTHPINSHWQYNLKIHATNTAY